VTEPAKTCRQCNSTMPEGSTSSLCAKCLLQVGFETDPGPASDSESRAYQPTFIAPTIDELAPHFPQLEIQEQIGHGGMGVVYKARQTELDRIVALKILRPNISNDGSFAERFQREARALAKLNHPNIITVYDFGRKDGLYFFIMEYVDGTNLRHVERTGQLSPQEALSIVPQVCSALQYAHDNGVVHRDIKPENILITKSGDVRIADFGLAKLAGMKDEAPLTGTWQVMGTPHYMAPEQFEKPTTVDHRADIYSLGVVIYELLTGELPLGRFLLPSEKVRVDVRLDDVVLRSLAKEPERRYQRVTDVATAVSDASSAQPTETLSAEPILLDRMKHNLKQGWIQSEKNARALHEYRHGLGTALIWISGIDVLISMKFLMNERSNDTLEFMSSTGVFAGSIAFWLGRQYRRNLVSNFLWFAAIVSIPWLSPLIVFSLARAGLTILILFILFVVSRNKASDSTDKNDSSPAATDFIDQGWSAVRTCYSVVTRRILVFTTVGILGWCIVFVPSIVGIGFFWFNSFEETIPSGLHRFPDSAVDSSFLIFAAVIWLVGLLRVLRILYRYLWRPAVAPSRANSDADDNANSANAARRNWRRCSFALAFSSLISCFMASAFFSATGMLNSNARQTEIVHKLPLHLPPQLFEAILMSMVLLSFAMIVGSALARPILRRFGLWIGMMTSCSTLLILPLNLITFPSGLAAWILLTDPAVRQIFRADAMNNSRELG
jgi:serine/threonine protein kinase